MSQYTRLSTLMGLEILNYVEDNVRIYNNVSLPQCEACDLLPQLFSYDAFSFHDNLADECDPSCP